MNDQFGSPITFKILYAIVFFLCLHKIQAQDNIPPLEFHSQKESVNPYLDSLHLDDENALILHLRFSNYWSKGVGYFIVFNTDGSIEKFLQKFKPNRKRSRMKRKHINKKDYKLYWSFLQYYTEQDSIKFDQTKLNCDFKTDPEPYFKDGVQLKRGSIFTRTDGTITYLSVYQNKKYLHYKSYELNYFIEAEVDGFEERKRYLAMIKHLGKLFMDIEEDQIQKE